MPFFMQFGQVHLHMLLTSALLLLLLLLEVADLTFGLPAPEELVDVLLLAYWGFILVPSRFSVDETALTLALLSVLCDLEVNTEPRLLEVLPWGGF